MEKKNIYDQLIREHGITALAEFIGYAHEQIIDTVSFQRTFGKLKVGNVPIQDATPALKALSIINKRIDYLIWENKFNPESFFAYKLSLGSKAEQIESIRKLLLRVLEEQNIYDADYKPDEDSEDWSDSDYARREKNEIAKELLDQFSNLLRMLSDEDSDERSNRRSSSLLDQSSNCAACDSNPCMCSDPFKTSSFR